MSVRPSLRCSIASFARPRAGVMDRDGTIALWRGSTRSGQPHTHQEKPMTRISEVERPGLAVRAFYRIGQAIYGRVPTPERLMAHRVPLMLGLGGLYAVLEWFGRVEPTLRALINVQVAELYGSAY